jgi:hypothetical protein
MGDRELRGGAARHPEDTEDPTGEFIHGEERDEGVGELTPLPDDAGGDTPPETDVLAELEEAVGRTLSDDLTREATQLKGDEGTAFGRPTGTA